jgi:hypothetical protein
MRSPGTSGRIRPQPPTAVHPSDPIPADCGQDRQTLSDRLFDVLKLLLAGEHHVMTSALALDCAQQHVQTPTIRLHHDAPWVTPRAQDVRAASRVCFWGYTGRASKRGSRGQQGRI